VGTDDVQIKFRGPKRLKDAIEKAAAKDMNARTVTAWLISASLEKLKAQGIDVEGESRKKGGK
jgi:Asp-tRNA(Asn)/Glu-tRNA(Gln) amidotransferase B subunit